MNAVLIVTKDRKQIAKVPVTGGSFTIGRANDCSLPIDEPLVSRHHSTISLAGSVFRVRDEGSRNGTRLNGEKLAANTDRELKDGDEIEIGSTLLRFVCDQTAEDDDDDRTRVASPADAGKKLPGAEVKAKKDVGSIQVKLRVVDGPLAGGLFRDWESPLTIGRSLENNVVLVDDAVSTRQAEIVQEGETYYLVDLKSSNGTFLEGVKVQKSQLVDGSKIKVGASTLVFERTDLRRQRKNLMVALISMVVIAVVVLLIKFLQPPDVAGQHIAAGQSLAQQGDFTKAQAEYEAALGVDPNRVEAKRGLAEAKEAIEAHDILGTAETEAAAENYDKAEDLCYRVLRDFPNNSRALELEAVIKSIQNAKIAFDAKNWLDAKKLLEKAQETYPKSQLISRRLAQVQDEIDAQQNLAKAQDAFQHQQFDLASPLLQSIPTNSVYFLEARQMLDQVATSRSVAEFLTKAQSLYAEGSIPEALQAIDAGLQQSPDNQTLLDLQKHLRQMTDLQGGLVAAEAVGQTEDVDVLLKSRAACDAVLNLERDPLNSFNKRAQSAETGIVDKLHTLAQSILAQANSTLQSGNRKEAYQLMDKAVKANPDDQNAAAERDQLKQKIVADCRSLFEQGLVHDDLGQNSMAHDCYQKVLVIGIPGEEYYERATRKLKGTSQ
ncbi:MAG TPA: FHA domain-containing protein [Candidatus Sulfotelmatobacter sp.]|nr:FHA domain-containing protein [Candidatus Sulfotelmatobacter sp.]